MPKKGKGKETSKAETLPSELEALLQAKINALQINFDAQVKEAEEAKAGQIRAEKALEKERSDRRDNVAYLNAELDKRQVEVDSLQARLVALQEEMDTIVRRLRSDLEKAKDKIAHSDQQIAQLQGEVRQKSDQLIELGQLKADSASDTQIKGQMSSELESLKFKLLESQQQLTVLAMADGREGGEGGEGVMTLLLLEVLRLHPAKYVLTEQAMVALQYVLSSDRHADAELVRTRGGVDLILDNMARHEQVADLLGLSPTARTSFPLPVSTLLTCTCGVYVQLCVCASILLQVADLQSAACGLLWKIAFADPPVRELVVKAGGVALIMASMQRHTAHPRLGYNACGALRHLLVSAPRQPSVSSQLASGKGLHPSGGNLPPITASASYGGGRRPGQSRGGNSSRGGYQFTNVPVGAPPRMVLAAGQSSRSGLRGASSDPHLRNPGVVGGGSVRPSTVAASTGVPRPRQPDLPEVKLVAREDVSTQALRLTLRSMADHGDAPLVQEYGCGTMFNLVLANPQGMRACILHDGGVPVVLRAMRTHAHAAGIQLNACSLIKELAEYQPCLQQLDEGGARQLLTSVLKNHEYNAELVESACEAMRFLPENPS